MEINLVDYMDFVRSVARRICPRIITGLQFKDLVAYGMVGLVEAKENFNSTKNNKFITFAYHRVRGSILDGLIKMGYHANDARIKKIYLDDDNELFELSSEDSSPEELIDSNRVREKVRLVFNRLPVQDRQIMYMYYVEDIKFKDIAKLQGISSSWMARRHQQTIAKCKRVFE